MIEIDSIPAHSAPPRVVAFDLVHWTAAHHEDSQAQNANANDQHEQNRPSIADDVVIYKKEVVGVIRNFLEIADLEPGVGSSHKARVT